MPRKAVVKKNYPKKNAPLFVPFIFEVVLCMTNNNYFEKPDVALTDLTEMGNTLQKDYMNRKSGGNAKDVFKLSLANAAAMVDKQADYVSRIADGRVAVITSANFEATKTSNSKSVTPQTPRAPTLENVNGALSISTDSVPGATSYFWVVFIGDVFPIIINGNQIEIDPKAKIILIPAGTTRELVYGLTSTTKVTVQVLAQNAAGKSAFSAPVSIGIA